MAEMRPLFAVLGVTVRHLLCPVCRENDNPKQVLAAKLHQHHKLFLQGKPDSNVRLFRFWREVDWTPFATSTNA